MSIEALQAIEATLKGGETGNEEVLEQLESLALNTCRQIIIEMGYKSGADLLETDKANLVSTLDAMCTMMFYPSWTPQPSEVEADEESKEIEQ